MSWRLSPASYVWNHERVMLFTIAAMVSVAIIPCPGDLPRMRVIRIVAAGLIFLGGILTRQGVVPLKRVAAVKPKEEWAK